MDLCVGAVSRLVVEEAAKLQVPQIVASRRQVHENGGYTGLNQKTLVEVVKDLSDGRTEVVRDHGGPHQNGEADDDWCASFDADVEAGFDTLHLDVSKLPREQQAAELVRLIERYKDAAVIEIGGERDEQRWLYTLLLTALDHCTPSFVVLDVGGHIHADRQQGSPRTTDWTRHHTRRCHDFGVRTKAHNFDFMGGKTRYVGALDAINIAPEYGTVEIQAWLQVMDFTDSQRFLDYAYATRWWTRWFDETEGTWLERARCAARYVLEDRYVRGLLSKYQSSESWVREQIKDALTNALA